jgi:hypothetical protein
MDAPIIRQYMSGLRANGALIPEEQARPIMLHEIRKLVEEARRLRDGDRLIATMFILIKTASRYNDVFRMTSQSIVLASRQRIIIAWLDRTKATRTDPYRPDSWTVIEHEGGIPMEIVNTLHRLEHGDTLCKHSTAWFSTWVAEHTDGPEGPCSAHSFKAAAAVLLARAVAENKLAKEIAPLVTKHKTQHPWCATFIRYASRDEIQTTLALQTQLATVLLPW